MKLSTRLANPADAPAISELLLRNSAAEGGALYGDWSLPVVSAWLAREVAVVVATDGDALVGVLFTDDPAAATAPPVLETLKVWPAKPGSYIYGPVCISQTHRGQGVFELLLNRLSITLEGREGVLFINQDNQRSLQAHARVGMQACARFELGGTPYVVLTFNGIKNSRA